MLPIVLREVRCEGCGLEFWPGDESYSGHWIMWHCDDGGAARGVRVECHKCHRRTSNEDSQGLCDQNLTPGWVGEAAWQAALGMLVTYPWPDAKDRHRIDRIAEAMSFAHLADG